ncbi:hypothetical protein CLV73_2574 [Chryseobacterium geocarposphaerae]|uniref:Uncharacterized protein n=1 Tax=Chryseobacterium geocarposphaerae TaxID=1416776 RepID=A0A2M9C1B7_9FLAO|nr:hypothetical protein CLV73_2574 [Chryseobacterium geocarposphaerae]
MRNIIKNNAILNFYSKMDLKKKFYFHFEHILSFKTALDTFFFISFRKTLELTYD